MFQNPCFQIMHPVNYIQIQDLKGIHLFLLE
uniref:Uncharacterized protein n=1 Tax=Myoviridae sp. ctCo31 TaxID=2825053 RepID=A0A8S5UM25_9CAUD|nr:MAG TPA: hypothetical protein [Myoviridae sp. ctCo31]